MYRQNLEIKQRLRVAHTYGETRSHKTEHNKQHITNIVPPSQASHIVNTRPPTSYRQTAALCRDRGGYVAQSRLIFIAIYYSI